MLTAQSRNDSPCSGSSDGSRRPAGFRHAVPIIVVILLLIVAILLLIVVILPIIVVIFILIVVLLSTSSLLSSSSSSLSCHPPSHCCHPPQHRCHPPPHCCHPSPHCCHLDQIRVVQMVGQLFNDREIKHFNTWCLGVNRTEWIPWSKMGGKSNCG